MQEEGRLERGGRGRSPAFSTLLKERKKHRERDKRERERKGTLRECALMPGDRKSERERERESDTW